MTLTSVDWALILYKNNNQQLIMTGNTWWLQRVNPL